MLLVLRILVLKLYETILINFCIKHSGFQPRETAEHHQQHIHEVLQEALDQSGIKPEDIDVVCYTKGPGMAPPLMVCAIVARTCAKLWNKPILGVNHCIGRILFTFF